VEEAGFANDAPMVPKDVRSTVLTKEEEVLLSLSVAELHPRATRTIANGFLDNLIKAVPYKIHTVLTDNGIQFTKREGREAYWTIPF
jgi:hypothetical protein